jgi:hypothetical protein
MKWCCDGFRNGYEFRHERGLLVFARPVVAGVATEPMFHIAFRALERDKHEAFSQAIKGRMDGCMSLSCCTGMRFCPWCGVELVRFYRSSWQELVDQIVIDEFIVV